MISTIFLKNYKAFDEVTIPIKPLTILLGANSVGKSSIIQMLMLLHQTAEERGGSYSSALKIYGNYVNLGAFENLFKGKKTDKPLRVCLSFSSSSLIDGLDYLEHSFFDDFRNLSRFFLSDPFDKDQYHFKSQKNFALYVDSVLERFNVHDQGRKQGGSYSTFFFRDRLGIPEKELRKKHHPSITKAYGMMKRVRQSLMQQSNDLNEKLFKVEYEIAYNREKNILGIQSVVFYLPNNTRILSYSKAADDTQIESDIIRLSAEDKRIITKYINFNQTVFDCVSEIEKESDINTTSFFLHRILQVLLGSLAENISGNTVNYVSPLRAHPKRYYMLDKAKMTISLDTLDGDAIAEVLKDNNAIKNKVNEWFDKFGFKVDVKGFKEVIHHVNVTQNNLSLDITDVGFGISQVLPIIIQGFLSVKNSITIIEQPEIHLHPQMQAELGDLFIDITKKNEKKLIIETHSEYLLKRIRRRIAEGVIPSNMVSICLFHPKTAEKDPWVEVLNVGETGAFTWPEEFYGGELYNDTIEYLKHQG